MCETTQASTTLLGQTALRLTVADRLVATCQRAPKESQSGRKQGKCGATRPSLPGCFGHQTPTLSTPLPMLHLRPPAPSTRTADAKHHPKWSELFVPQLLQPSKLQRDALSSLSEREKRTYIRPRTPSNWIAKPKVHKYNSNRGRTETPSSPLTPNSTHNKTSTTNRQHAPHNHPQGRPPIHGRLPRRLHHHGPRPWRR